MKILIISTLEVAPWGGSEDLWYLLALRLLEQGHQVQVDRLHWKEAPKKLNELIGKGATVSYRPNVHLPVRKTDFVTRLSIFRFNRGFERRMRFFTPDRIIISLAGTFDNHLMRLGPFLLNHKIPFTILAQHTPENLYLSNHKRHLFRQVFQQATNVFFVAQRNREITERSLALQLTNASVVCNPIKIRQDVHLPFPALDPVKLACVARLDTEYKGQDILLQALGTDKWKSRNWILSLYGKGPSEEYLLELITYYGLTDKVFLRGHVDQLEDVWASHHMLILPSHSEGTPLSLLEAAYCSRPAIVTDVGGNAEVVAEGSEGFVAPAPTVCLLDAAMERAWAVRENWAMLGQAAKQKVERLVSYNNFDVLLKTVLEGSRK